MAKRILLNNAYESWMQAVEYAKLLQDGVCTLGYKKRFVSSLHNAVELFLKQIMLDNCDYRIATIKNGISADGSPIKDFYQATDLNKFFSDLSPEIRKKFFTIEFSELIPICCKDLIMECSFNEELSILNKLRNDETHFYVDDNDYLADGEFKILFNFMVDFYEQLGKKHLLPWAFGTPIGEGKELVFNFAKLNSFCFTSAIKKSSVAHIIRDTLYQERHNACSGDCTDDPYAFTEEIWNCIKNNKYSFERIMAYVDSLMRAKAIKFTPVEGEIPDEFGGGSCIDYYEVKIKVL